MKKEPLVSVIIPTYNRAHLIGETLDSVLAQTYQNWECIIVDDGSSDDTDEVVGEYVKKDSRFKYYHRPEEHLPGGNGARNYGFKMSQGEYVNWFDSDDLMHEEKISKQINLTLEKNVELVIDKYKNFTKSFTISKFEDKLNNIDLKDYIFHKIKWGTVNLLINRNHVEDVFFNETLKSGQEYNFFVKLIVSKNLTKALLTDEYLVHRRVHSDSIQQKQKIDPIIRHKNKFHIYWETYNEVYSKLNKEEKHFLEKMFSGHFFQLLINNIKIIKPIELVRKTRKHKYQIPYLLFLINFVLYSKKGSLKIRNQYLKTIY